MIRPCHAERERSISGSSPLYMAMLLCAQHGRGETTSSVDASLHSV